MKLFITVQPHKRWHPRDYSYFETFYDGSTSQKAASQWWVLLWNIFLWLNLTKGGMSEISLICKTFYHGSTSQKVASQRWVLLWNDLLWFTLSKGGIREIVLIVVKPFSMAQPHKRWHPRDFFNGKHLTMVRLTNVGIPEISYIVKPFTTVQPHKRWHPRDES